MRSSAPGRVEDRPRVDLGGHRERDPAREVGLDQAGHDVDRRPLRGEDHVDARGARLLGEPDDRVLDVLALAHHQVGELVDDDDDVRHPVFGIDPGLVERADVAGGRAGQPPVARLHLVDRPLERGLARSGSVMTGTSRCGRPL